jgi:hypothetical protein
MRSAQVPEAQDWLPVLVPAETIVSSSIHVNANNSYLDYSAFGKELQALFTGLPVKGGRADCRQKR